MPAALFLVTLLTFASTPVAIALPSDPACVTARGDGGNSGPVGLDPGAIESESEPEPEPEPGADEDDQGRSLQWLASDHTRALALALRRFPREIAGTGPRPPVPLLCLCASRGPPALG